MLAAATLLALTTSLSIFPPQFDSTLIKRPEAIRVAAVRVSERPAIDGRLDDAVWQRAPRLTDFVQYEPVDLVRPESQSVAYIAYDADHLYVAFRAYEKDRSRIRATIHPRERGGELDDKVSFTFDTFHDRRRTTVFRVTPLGLQEDGVKVEGRSTDDTPDFVWTAAGRIDDEGWTVEAAIPFASLRFPQRDTIDIGFDVVRTHGRTGTRDSWATRRRGSPCDICQQGTLLGLTGINRRRTVDILPYVTASTVGTRLFGADSVLVDGQYRRLVPPRGFDMARPDGEYGADVRFSLTPSLVLNGTVNPDFSQVEADDEQIRVGQRFALFFQERRPFFLEGRDVFQVGGDDAGIRNAAGELIYTRSIVDPSAGARLTAKEGRYTLGLLYAHDARPAFFFYDGHEASGVLSQLGQAADVVVARARRDVLRDSYIGVTALGRTAGSARNGVAAADLLLRRGQFTLTAEGGASTERARLDTDRSPWLDGATQDGTYYRARLIRTGRRFSYSAGASATSPKFRNQLGRFSRAGTEAYGARFAFAQYPNNRWFQNLEQRVTFNRTNVYGGGLLDYMITPGFEFQFQGRAFLDLAYEFERTTLYGTPLDQRGPVVDFSIDRWRKVSLGGVFFAGDREIFDPDRPRVGKGINGRARITLRPSARSTFEARLQRANHYERWGGALVDDARILRLRGTYQFTRALGARLIGEYSDQFDALVEDPDGRRHIRYASSLLLSYELGPASFLYVGYNDAQQEYDEPLVDRQRRMRTANQLFLKLSYLFRI